MILRKDVLGKEICPDKYEANLLELLIRVNKMLDACGLNPDVTSGFRTMKRHIDIYAKKGIPLNKVPMSSNHLYCKAVDLYDPEKKLQLWIKDNVSLVEEIGLWFEDFEYTKNWVHCQIEPPKSMNRFFKPW